MNELHLFAGAGGGILAGQLHGRRCICAVEVDPYAQAVLIARQNDGTFPPFPIWDDVRTFDGHRWRGIADVVAGGFPCQDVSAAGTGDGLDGERSGLWTEMARIIREVRPRRVEVENSPMLTSRGLGRVLGDLAQMGFDVEWGVLSAADTGAPHLRERIWIMANARSRRRDRASGREMEQPWGAEVERGSQVMADAGGERYRDEESALRAGRHSTELSGANVAYPDSIAGEQRRPHNTSQGSGRRDFDRSGVIEDVANAMREREQGIVAGGISSQDGQESRERSDRSRSYGYGRWPVEPGMGRVVDGMANRAHRIRTLGNGQVSRVAAAAPHLLKR